MELTNSTKTRRIILVSCAYISLRLFMFEFFIEFSIFLQIVIFTLGQCLKPDKINHGRILAKSCYVMFCFYQIACMVWIWALKKVRDPVRSGLLNVLLV